MIRAWIMGTLILTALYAVRCVYSLVHIHEGPLTDIFRIALVFAPTIAGFLVAILAPRKKIRLAASMCLQTTVLFMVFNSLMRFLNHGIFFPGYPGDTMVYTVMLAYSAVFALIGGLLGWLFSRKKSENDSLLIKSAEQEN
jgi:hypothetical protein